MTDIMNKLIVSVCIAVFVSFASGFLFDAFVIAQSQPAYSHSIDDIYLADSPLEVKELGVDAYPGSGYPSGWEGGMITNRDIYVVSRIGAGSSSEVKSYAALGYGYFAGHVGAGEEWSENVNLLIGHHLTIDSSSCDPKPPCGDYAKGMIIMCQSNSVCGGNGGMEICDGWQKHWDCVQAF